MKYNPTTPTVYGHTFNRIKTEFALHVPESDTETVDTLDTSPQIRVIGGVLKLFFDGVWTTLGASPGFQDVLIKDSSLIQYNEVPLNDFALKYLLNTDLTYGQSFHNISAAGITSQIFGPTGHGLIEVLHNQASVGIFKDGIDARITFFNKTADIQSGLTDLVVSEHNIDFSTETLSWSNASTGVNYVLTDVAGDGNLTMQPSTGGGGSMPAIRNGLQVVTDGGIDYLEWGGTLSSDVSIDMNSHSLNLTGNAVIYASNVPAAVTGKIIYYDPVTGLMSQGDVPSATAISSGLSVNTYGAVPDGKMVNDAVVTAGSTTVTSASASFSSADIGKTISIPYAGTGAVVGQSHITTIAAVVNSTTITLAVAPFRSIVGPRTLTDVACSSGGLLVNSATGAFTSGDIGKFIIISGVGLIQGISGGNPQPCWITLINSGTQVTVNRKNLATVSSQTLLIPGATLVYGTNNFTSIQNAMNAGSTQLKPVFLESGKYLVNGELIIASNLKLIGQGAAKSTIYHCGTGGSCLRNATSTPTAILTDLEFSSFEIDSIGNGVSTYSTVNKGIYFRYCTRLRIANMTIRNTSATGIGVDCLIDYQIINNTMSHCGRSIPELTSSGGGAGIGVGCGVFSIENGIISGNSCKDCGTHGIFIESQTSTVTSTGCKITGNSCEWNLGSGIGDFCTDGTVVSGNTCDYNNDCGIKAFVGFVANTYSKNCVYTSNSCKYNNSSGIFLTYKDGSMTIANNSCLNPGNGHGGIRVNIIAGGTPADLIILGNQINGGLGRGIYLDSGTFRTVKISNNVISDVGTSSSTRRPGIGIGVTSIARLYLDNNVAYDSRASGSKCMSYGFQLTAGTVSKLVMNNNDFEDCADGTYDVSAGTVTVKRFSESPIIP